MTNKDSRLYNSSCNNYFYILIIVVLLSFIINPETLWATSSSCSSCYKYDSINFDLGLGVMAGESKEYVYEQYSSHKISELDWKINSSWIIKGQINADVLSWLTVNVSGWNTIVKGDAYMNDYDWLFSNQSSWSHHSYHENTRLKNANEIDVKGIGWFINNYNVKLGVLAGFEWSSFSYLANGGCYSYYNGVITGCFPANEKVIGYRQRFATPIIGLSGKFTRNDFEFSGDIKYGPWVTASDTDEHYLRNLIFKERGTNAKFYSADLTAGYYICSSTKLFLQGVINEFTNARANTTITSTSYSGSISIPDSAGLSNKNYIAALGVLFIPGR